MRTRSHYGNHELSTQLETAFRKKAEFSINFDQINVS